MRKLVGSSLVFGAGVFLWYLRMAERRRQRETLREMIASLRRMGEEIRLARTPLPDLLERLANSCQTDAGDFFREGAAMLRRGQPWRPTAERLPFPKTVQQSLCGLAFDLHGDERKVCNVISLVIIELEKERREREERRPGEEKQLTAMCFSLSAMLVILLI